MDAPVLGWIDGQIRGWMGRWLDGQTVNARGVSKAVEGACTSHPGSHLSAEVHLVQQLDPQQDADLVELLGHIQVLLQVPLHQGVQHPPIDQVVLEGLGVLG